MTPFGRTFTWILGGAVLMAGAQAHAAASITANPNPVCAPNNTSGNTTVSWNTGTANKFGRLKRKKVGSTTWQPVAEGSGKGSVAQTLAAGTWEFRLHKYNDANQWTNQPLLVESSAAACNRVQIKPGLTKKPPQDLSVSPQKAMQLVQMLMIEDVTVEHYGNGLKFHIKTNKDAKLKLRLHSPPAPPHRICDETLKPKAATFALGWKKTWDTHLLNLDPGKNYQFEVCAEDKDGKKAHRTGGTKTLRRRVEVKFKRIDVSNDSDDLSAGDFTWRFYVHNNAPFTHSADVDTGGHTNVNKSGAVMSPPDQIKVKVQGWDDDQDEIINEFCSSPPGGNCYGDWGETTRTVSTETGGQVSTETTPFSWPVSGHDIAFTVKGEVIVTYVP